jgi:TonB family protein
MPPTIKDSSSTLSTSPEKPERSAETSPAPEEISSAQPVALEVPVTVNGTRAVEGSDKRETFSEKTNTVLVLANGAVIRLSSSVAPGQLLFLTNEKTRKEIVCQVVKSKNYRSVSGYVELEFTEPVMGFWGMRFPGDRHGSQAGGTLVAERKSDSTPSRAEIPPKGVVPKPDALGDVRPAAVNVTPKFVDAAQEFKAEIKLDSRPQSKADLLSPAEPSIDGLKLEANRLQEQLSALLFAEQQKSEAKPPVAGAPPSKQELGDAAAKIVDMASEEPSAPKPKTIPAKSDNSSSSVPAAPKSAPAPVTAAFEEEQVKIPAWLEPLARNAAISAPPAEEDGGEFTTQSEHGPTKETPESASVAKHATGAPKKAASTPKQSGAPIFGNTLLGQSNPKPAAARGSSKGIWMAIAAALIAAAASGGWYFRDALTPLVSLNAMSRSSETPVSAITSRPAANAAVSGASSLTPVATPDTSSPAARSNPASTVSEASARVSTPGEGKVQAAAITERIPKSISSNDVVKAPATSDESLEPEIKKPSLGQVRLAKPKIGRSGRQANGEIEPVLEVGNGAPSTGDSSLGANFAESAKQPTAPEATVQVGGEVKPARMISSVPPVYPALAKNQHVAGDVRVDALIDSTGRVTTMKVVAGPSLLQQAAMDALRQWKYQPATLDGKPVAMHLTVTIQFRLQ